MLIVDDHPSFRAIARSLLVADGFTVVGEAADGAEAIRACRVLRPDVVLLDVGLPDIDGFQVAAALDTQCEPPVVVLVSTRSCADYGSKVGSSTARGFIGKSELSGAAVRAILGTPGPPARGVGPPPG